MFYYPSGDIPLGCYVGNNGLFTVNLTVMMHDDATLAHDVLKWYVKG